MFISVPKIIGHRGAAGLAIENTLPAFDVAAKHGVTWVEVDLRLSKDCHIFIYHDDDLERLLSHKKSIEEMTSVEIKKLHFKSSKETIPTLEELFKKLSELKLSVNLELKPTSSHAKELVLALKRFLNEDKGRSMPQFYISSFDREVLSLCAQELPEVARGFLCTKIPVDWQEFCKKIEAWCLSLDHTQNSLAQIEQVVKKGLPVSAYTVNELKHAQELFDVGVVSIFTDRPDVMTCFL